MAKNNPTEKQISAEIQATLKHRLTHRRENVILITWTDRFKLQITTTYPNMFSFGLFSVISKVYVSDFEHVFVCLKRCR